MIDPRYSREVHRNLSQLEAEVTRALRGVDAKQAQATPLSHPDKWSIQQIIEHLLLTYRATLPVIQIRLDKGTPTQSKPSLAQHIGQIFVISLGRFPHGRPAPISVVPASPTALRSGEELIQSLHHDLGELDALLSQAEGLFGKVQAASHIVLGPLSMDQWRRFHLVHGRHHVKQVLAIRRDHAS